MNTAPTSSKTINTEDRSGESFSDSAPLKQEWVIRPRRFGILNALRDLWDYRSIFGFIAVNSILENNRKRILGMAWLVIRPALTVVAAVQVLGKVLGVSTDPVPLVLFIVISLSLWRLFAAGLRYGTRATTKGRALIRRVNFPRLMLLLGVLAPSLIEFAVVFVGALGVYSYLAYTGAFVPTTGWRVFGIIPTLVWVLILITALSCVTSVLNNLASDTSIAVNYGTSFLFFATPVLYPLTALPREWKWAFLLNPMSPILEIWRWALLDTSFPPWWSVITAVATTLILLFGGLSFFLRWEQTILDRS